MSSRNPHTSIQDEVILSIMPPFNLDGFCPIPVGLCIVLQQLHNDGIDSRMVLVPDFPSPPDDLILQCAYGFFLESKEAEELERVTNELIERHSELVERILQTLLAGNQHIFGFSVWINNAYFTMAIARLLKQRRPESIIVLGGPHAMYAPEMLQENTIDAVMHGFNQTDPADIFDFLMNEEKTLSAPLPGVWFNERYHDRINFKEGTDASTAKRWLSSLPMIEYQKILPLFKPDEIALVPFLLTLGCPRNCGFCLNKTLYSHTVQGDPKTIVEALRYVRKSWTEQYGRSLKDLVFIFADAAINSYPKNLDRLCELIIEEHWEDCIFERVNIIANESITPERAKLLAQAGFISFNIGLESGSDRVRRAMRKPGNVESVRNVLLTLAEACGSALNIALDVIIGWPDETEAEFYDTIKFLEWALNNGLVHRINIMPLIRVKNQPMDWSCAQDNHLGFAWQADSPAGSPEIRYRRLIHFISHFHNRLVSMNNDELVNKFAAHIIESSMVPELPDLFSIRQKALGSTRLRSDAANSAVSGQIWDWVMAESEGDGKSSQIPTYARALTYLLDPGFYPDRTFGRHVISNLEFHPHDNSMTMSLTPCRGAETIREEWRLRIIDANKPDEDCMVKIGKIGLSILAQDGIQQLALPVEIQSFIKYLKILDKLDIL